MRKEDRKNYDTLIDTISWFFFDLLFLGYVEDSHSGESFHLPGGLSWSIYVEVSFQSWTEPSKVVNLLSNVSMVSKCGFKLPLSSLIQLHKGLPK